MMETPRIELACFDLGRVLIDVCIDFDDGCRLAGIKVPQKVNDPEIRRQMHNLCNEHDCGRIDLYSFADRMSELTTMTPAEVIASVGAWLKGPYPNVCEMIAKLRQTVQVACLANTNALHWTLLTEDQSDCAALLDMMHYHFSSHTIGYLKPDDRVYQYVESVTGFQPHQILYFDDRPEYCRSARLRGWCAHQILRDGQPLRQIQFHLAEYGLA